jgi:hypothetical protein
MPAQRVHKPAVQVAQQLNDIQMLTTVCFLSAECTTQHKARSIHTPTTPKDMITDLALGGRLKVIDSRHLLDR